LDSSIRPIQIRKECIKKYPFAFYEGGGLIGNSGKAQYKECLLENGIED